MKFKNGEEFVSSLVNEYCPEPVVSSTIRLDTYYKKAHSMFHQALDFVKQGNDARSYIELMRYAQLIMQLQNHNNYNLKQYEKEKNLNKRRLNNAITKLEELKPKLIKSYNDEIKKEKEQKEKKAQEKEEQEQEEEEEEETKEEQEQEQEEEQKQEITTTNPNRWNNLKIESSPYYNKAEENKGKKVKKIKKEKKEKNQGLGLDAIFKKDPLKLTSIYMTDNLVTDFIKFAESNTRKDIETCGVLTGKYLHSEDSYLITHVIIPKQKGSANTVQTLAEEELIGIQEKYGIITLGWIHTHPSQTCFLSSVDMHCQLSYQIMMNNAIAIVYAPKDKTETFTLTKKGINVLSNCNCQGFHRHEGVSGLYQKANHVFIAKHQKCKFIDLRGK